MIIITIIIRESSFKELFFQTFLNLIKLVEDLMSLSKPFQILNFKDENDFLEICVK